MSRWDAKRDMIKLDGSCLATGCDNAISHTADMQPDVWCAAHLEAFEVKRQTWFSPTSRQNSRDIGERNEWNEQAQDDVLRETGTKREIASAQEARQERAYPYGVPVPPEPR